MRSETGLLPKGPALWVGLPLLLIMLLPGLALVLSAGASKVWAAFFDPAFLEALLLSLLSSTVAIALILISGTPLAWWPSTSLELSS